MKSKRRLSARRGRTSTRPFASTRRSSNASSRGEAYLQAREFTKATADFTQVLECAEEGTFLFRNALRLRGFAYLQSNQQEDALRDYERLLHTKSLAVDDACTVPVTVEMIRAGMFLLTDRTDEYRQACADMLKQCDGLDAWGIYTTARACMLAPDAVEDPLQVVELARRAASTTRVDREPWYTFTLGMAYCRAGEFEKAIECLQAFTKNDELTARGRYALALAHHYAGNSAEARKYLAQALEGNAEHGPGPRLGGIGSAAARGGNGDR